MCDQCESDFEELLDNVVERHGTAESYDTLKQLQKQLRLALTQAREDAEDAFSDDVADDEIDDALSED